MNQAIKDLFANNGTITKLRQKWQERMRKLFSYAAISVAAMLSLPAIAMPSKFDSLDNATFCSVDQGHSVILIDSKGTTAGETWPERLCHLDQDRGRLESAH